MNATSFTFRESAGPWHRYGFPSFCSGSPSHNGRGQDESSNFFPLPFVSGRGMLIIHTSYTLRADLIEDFRYHFNSIEPSNQFTPEAKSEGQFAFLDVLISHNPDGLMDIKVYRKPTHTNKFFEFPSLHPLVHKNIHRTN